MYKPILVFLLLGITFYLPGQDPCYYSINDENGLPSNEVYKVIQDKKGFIWIAADAGLWRFNGIKYQRYYNKNQQASALTGLALSEDSILYCHNFSNQIFYVKNDSLYELKEWEGMSKKWFPRLAVDKQNKLWISADNKLYSFDEKKGELILHGSGLGRNRKVTTSIVSDCNGNVFYGEDESVKAVNGTVYPIRFEAGASKNLSDYILCADSQSLWLISISGGGIYRKNDVELVPFASKKLKSILATRKVTSVAHFMGRLFITTYSGLVVYDTYHDELEVWYEKEIFSSALIDNEHNVWLTTLRNGIYFIPQENFRVWNKAEGQLPENRITDLIGTPRGISFTMQNGFVGLLDDTSNSVLLYKIPIQADIRTLFYDSIADQLFFNSNNTLYVLSQDRVSHVSHKFGPVKKMVLAGEYYVVCTSFGAFGYGSFFSADSSAILTDLWSRDAVFVDRTKNLFIATNNGLLKGLFRYGVFNIEAEFFPKKQIVSLWLERDETVLVLTFKGEVYECRGSMCRKVCEINSDALVYDVIQHDQKIYIATSRGLHIYDTLKKSWAYLNRLSGLASNDVYGIMIRKDRIWLATSKGLQSIPLVHRLTKSLPHIYLKNVMINGKNATSHAIELDYNAELSIATEVISYVSQGNFRFAYRLMEGDTSWRYVNASDEHFVVAGLKPGRFTVEIMAVDYMGRYSDNRIVVKGIMRAPFSQQWWFYVLVALVATSITYLFFMARISSLRKRQAEKIARMELENELAISREIAIKAQMNPHFIFNVLNSIKSYIYENDKKSAMSYLNKFAELVRGVLSFSSLPKIKLSDDLHTLNLYIQLEEMLLEPPFRYHISVNDTIDADAVFIPTLIIQPFVENAFKHGLRHKNGEKTLSVGIEPAVDDNHILVVISDNGIGRKKSAELNKSQNEGHQSFATEASTRRLAMINREARQQILVEYTDLYDEAGNACGTKVVLNISI